MRVTVPPPFSSLSAATEVLVTVAVLWFFYHALRHRDYRWGVIVIAIAYEALFNISYMVVRAAQHEEGVTHRHAAWVSWFVGLHGALSLLMFLGLIVYVAWAARQVRGGLADPIGRQRPLAFAFLALWMLSVLSGEAIYVFYWTGVVT